jgi:probable HAF family extracellular repeat protein
MKIVNQIRKYSRAGQTVLVLSLSLAGSNLFGQFTITNVPTLGGTFAQAEALNNSGMVAGFSRTAGNLEQHAFQYSAGVLRDLGTLSGRFSVAWGVNETGQVIGDSSAINGTETHAFLFSGNAMMDLGTLGGTISTAAAINSSGQVAGNSTLGGDVQSRAFLYTNGILMNLGSLGGIFSSAAAMNDHGEIVGDAFTTNNAADHAFLFSGNSMNDLGTLGGSYSAAFAINNAGQVAGESETTNGDNHAFFYGGGVMIDLGTFGGSFSTAYAINNSGQAIGEAAIAEDMDTHGFIYSNGIVTDLGTFGGTYSTATAINNLGQVVGSAADASGNTQPFLWQNGVLTNLNTLLPTNSGWQLRSAQLINDAGQIVGLGLYNGTFTTFLLSRSTAANGAPVANAGPDQTVECSSSLVLNGSQSSDPDGDSLTYEWLENGILLATGVTPSISLSKGSHTITLNVADPHGQNALDSVLVNVVDTTPPMVTCPVSRTAVANADCLAAVPDLTGSVVATDSCTPSTSLARTQAPAAGTLVGLGVHSIIVTVTDGSGNSSTCMTAFTVSDNTPPSLVCPPPATASADGTGQAAVPDFIANLNATDACSPPAALVKTQDPAAGMLLGLGAHVVTLTVTDAAGNTATCAASLTIVDTTPPLFACPAPVAVSPAVDCAAAVPDFTANLNATDNCTPSERLVTTQNPATGTVVGSGTHSVTLIVTDAAGNSSTCATSFTVKDITPPSVTCPTARVASANDSCQAAVPDLLSGLSASDNCTPAGDLIKTQNPAAGTLAGLGTQTITVTVSDSAGNSTVCSTTFTVSDTTPPVIASVAANPSVIQQSNHEMIPVVVQVSASDNCDPNPVSRIISITSDEPVTGQGDNTSPDWAITGPLSAEVRAERSPKGNGRLYTITVECIDASGNGSISAVTVFVTKQNSPLQTAKRK